MKLSDNIFIVGCSHGKAQEPKPETTFDYQYQVYIRNGKVENCGHPSHMRTSRKFCCNANMLAGIKFENVKRCWKPGKFQANGTNLETI